MEYYKSIKRRYAVVKKGLLFTLVAALLLPMCLSLTAHAAVYLGTGDNVDSGGHLDWDYIL